MEKIKEAEKMILNLIFSIFEKQLGEITKEEEKKNLEMKVILSDKNKITKKIKSFIIK